MLLRWRINLLSLVDVDTRSLSIRITLLRWAVIGLVALAVEPQVPVSGVVGWVGLVVPHLAPMLVSPDHRLLLPTLAFLDGSFTLVANNLACGLAIQELPAGLLIALIRTSVFSLLF